MDDLKIMCPNELELKKSLHIVKTFSDDIQMSFGIDKCETASLRKGELSHSENVILEDGDEIKSLENGEVYKYLGILKGGKIEHNNMKTNLTQEYLSRIRKIL